MNSTKHFLKFLLLIFGLFSSLSPFADPVTWELTFRSDKSGEIIGSGQFSYDPTTSLVINGINVNTAIDSFSFNISNTDYGTGTEHDLSESSGGWGDEKNFWAFISGYHQPGTFFAFLSDFIQNSETSWTGRWNEFVHTENTIPGETEEIILSDHGTVTAIRITPITDQMD